nr:4Fe-4S ferredoxin [Bacteroidales bacterium]
KIHIHFNKIKAKKEQKVTEQLVEEQQHNHQHQHSGQGHHHGGSCPGSAARSLRPQTNQSVKEKEQSHTIASQLENWPIQMHLINPNAAYFKDANLLLAADCVAFSYGNFHNDFLLNKKLIIACPKLDSNREIYVEKLIALIQDARIKSINVVKMEVPCCSGLLSLAEKAKELAGSNIPVNSITISIDGKIL